MPSEESAAARDQFHALAMQVNEESIRRQSADEANREAFRRIRDAIDRHGDELQRLIRRVEGHGARLDAVHDLNERLEDALMELRRSVDDTQGILHARITKTRDLLQESTRDSEARVLGLLRDWAPYVIAGVVAAAAGIFALRVV